MTHNAKLPVFSFHKQTLCSDDRDQGFGRRRRSSHWNQTQIPDYAQTDGLGKTREILIEQVVFPNGTIASGSSRHLKGWETDLALRVAMPGGTIILDTNQIIETNAIHQSS